MIKNEQFAHLHVHDQYSQLDGLGTAKQYATAAKEMGFAYLGSTNHGNIDGLIEFQKACDKVGILPVSGVEMYIVPNPAKKDKGEKRGHVVVFIKNKAGYIEVCRMLTKANLEGFHYKPRIGFQDLLEVDLSNIVISTACTNSFAALPGGEDFVAELYDKGADLYCEIMPHNIEAQVKHNNFIADLAEDLKLPLLATNDCHYIEDADTVVQEVLLAIQRGATWKDKNRFKFDLDGLYLKSAREMFRAFRRQNVFEKGLIEEGMFNTLEIAEKCCDFRIEKQDISLPDVTKYGYDPDRAVYDMCMVQLEVLFKRETEQYVQYRERFHEEFDLISKKKFSKYFLVVKEIIDWCEEKEIMVGPGRGSVGGCLIAYLMGITSVDPIKFDLSFSRFISEDRIDWPDIDIDFEKIHRPAVRKHIEMLYGENNTCGISTFMKMKSRAVIRDVGRVFDLPSKKVDEFAKSIPYTYDGGLGSFIDTTEEGMDFYENYPEQADIAIRLDGQIRGSGQHAAAVVISADDLTKGHRGNLCRRSGNIVANWNMKDSEYVGLMKLDILGLGTLSVLSEARRLIRTKGCRTRPFCYHAESDCYLVVEKGKNQTVDHPLEMVDFDFDKIPLDSGGAFDMIKDGKTGGMFQLSARPTTELCKEMAVNSFDEIVAAIALVRPGPTDSGMTKDYIKRKNGKQWKPGHPIYETITKDTYGLLVYQEQVMQVISKMAGLPESTADKIRKIIGKKRDPKEFEKYRKEFIAGCLKEKTFSKKQAEDFWTGLLKWASYGFNKAHSVGYALIAYWTAWVKTHYPAEFYCALLTYGDFDGDGAKSKQRIIDEAKDQGFTIMPPKVGISHSTRWLNKERVFHAPFVEIKGVGEKQAVKCCAMKKTRVAPGFFDIKVSRKSKSAMENLLDDVGAFDEGIPPKISNHFEFNFFDEPTIMTKREVVRRRFRCIDVDTCHECALWKECTKGVPSSLGIFNIMICGEAPGKEEDRQKKPFVGPAGELMWDVLLYNIPEATQRTFHVTNACKCYPKETKTPTKKQLKTCWIWLKEEIDELRPAIILAFGNTGLYTFSGKSAGIEKMNGVTEWSQKAGCLVTYCIHPSAVLRSPSKRDLFEEGIAEFAQSLSEIPGSPNYYDDVPF